MDIAHQLSISLLRYRALEMFKAGIAAANPYLAVKRFLKSDSGKLSILLRENGNVRTGSWSRIHLIAFGKAACPMLEAALEVIPPPLLGHVLAVTNYENVIPFNGVEVIGSGHPLPDESGLKAAKKCAAIAKNAQSGELVLVLVSGGGSALLPYPADAISLADKILTTQLLLASGATINEINCVRKHLSLIKGGGLARMIAPADCHALILSDVIGDDLSAIASGPTIPDETTYSDAIAILQTKKIWNKVPETVRIYLDSGQQGKADETPKPDDPCFANTGHTLIGSNRISVNACIKAAQEHGFDTFLFSDNLCGEANDAARELADFAKDKSNVQENKPLAILSGGETTVTLKGNGKGGRNQEMALSFAIQAKQQNLSGNWVFLSGGTDGRDGPTDVAGAVVDAGTLSRITEAGLIPAAILADNDSYNALKASDDLLITGATGTNVADLQILLIQS